MVHAIADATRRWVLGTVIVALAGAGAACQNSPEISDGLTVPLGETGSRLGQALESRVAHLDGVHAREIRSLYETRRYELIWVDEGGFTRQGRALLDFLLGKDPVPSTHFLEQHLLEIERLAEAALGTPTAPSEIQAEALAELEVAVSRAAFRYADHMTSGQLRPKAVSEQWFIRDVTPDLVTYLAEAVHSQDIAQAFVELAERHQGYGALRDALLNYRSLLEQGGWPRVPDVETLELGSRGAAVAALRRRLEIEGDLPPTSSQRPIFDGDAESAVKRFQRRHGLTPDGVAGDATLAELNVSADERVRQLELNLERRRWMPEDFGEEYVLVNIPAFELFAYRNGELALEMRVVVGKPMHATPIFADEIELVVFRPYWNVPPSIALDEILPNVAADPDYLTRKNYEIVRLGGKSDPLDAEAVRRGLARIRQLPGPGNALGLVKFLFPNNHHVYLHDTPSDHLFDASRRAFSHGCIRLDRPAAFAKYVLEGSWSEEEIRGAMHGRTRRSVRLREKIPVFIAYTTAWVSADGRVHFRRDLYGHDASLARELEAHRKRDAAWRPLVARRMRRFLDSARPGDSVRQIVP